MLTSRSFRIRLIHREEPIPPASLSVTIRREAVVRRSLFLFQPLSFSSSLVVSQPTRIWYASSFIVLLYNSCESLVHPVRNEGDRAR